MSASTSPPTTTAEPQRQSRPQARTSLTFRVADTLDDVQQAWSLVYDSYCRQELIRPNAHRIHLVPEAVRPGSAVIVGLIRDEVVSTMTLYPDGDGALALDRVYSSVLDDLRHTGRRLVEVGLFADRRERISRSVSALMELMRYTFFYAVSIDATDIMIGVHPHHAGFYQRCFGFEVCAETAGCPSVNGSPMVPLRLAIPETYGQDKLPRGLAYFKSLPLNATTFDHRAELTPQTTSGTRIGAFLQDLTATASC